ncbi:MAG: lactate utilization protein C [Chloroflexi bacterium]|nr:MAG: lactate utilization protein C [Chloroflexota bacterium]
MSNARDRILERVRAALRTAPPDAGPVVPRDYRQQSDVDQADIQAEFIAKVRDYQALVEEVAEADLPGATLAICRERGVRRLAAPEDLPADWLPSQVEILRDAPSLTSEALELCDGVLTCCALAIAETGTLVLDGGARQGRRVLTLLPDLHLCVVFADQIVGMVPEALAWLSTRAKRPITFISGPSATSDIELSRVEGVHGPRTLVVLIITNGRAADSHD